MNKYKKLINNSIIFAIGNMGSKLMQFVLVPVYSYSLTTSEFGRADFLNTLVNLLSPLLCLDMIDGVFRFSLDKLSDKKKVLSTGLIFTGIISLMVLIIGILTNGLTNKYPVFSTVCLLIVTTFFGLISNFVRAMGYVKEFTIAGVINTFSMGILNIILLIFLHLGIKAYLNAFTIGQLIAIVYLLFSTPVVSQVSFKSFDFPLLREMSLYSVPLIPNTFAWWLNSASDRFFILAMISASANGIYSMVNRLPSMLSTLMNIFSQSWQMSAVEEFDKSDSKVFISNVFEYIISLVFLLSTFMILVIKPVIRILLSPSYYNGWKLVPFMLLAVIYMIVSSFLGVLYTARKETGGVFISTLLGAAVNVAFTIVLIKVFGIYGAAVANIISFFIVAAYRFNYMRNIGKIEINIKKIILLHCAFLVSSINIFFVSYQIIFFTFGLMIVVLQILCDSRIKFLLIRFWQIVKFKLNI